MQNIIVAEVHYIVVASQQYYVVAQNLYRCNIATDLSRMANIAHCSDDVT
jgi:hypothetical protein